MRSEGTVWGVEEIERRIPHRFPLLLIDRIVELETGKRAVGIKGVTINEAFFTGHFPQQAVMPGVLLLEGMAQVAAVLCAPPEVVPQPKFLGMINQAKFFRPVLPGDRLHIAVEVIKILGPLAKVRAEVRVEKEIVATAELTFVDPTVQAWPKKELQPEVRAQPPA